MDSFRSIIDAFGAAGLSEVLGLPDSHIRTMRARDSIPAEYWPRIVEKAPRGTRSKITLETLASLRARRFPPARTEAAQ